MSTTSHANEKQEKEDLALIVKYIKNDLYPKVKFIYNARDDLAVTGRIYRNFLSTCKDRIGGPGLTAQHHKDYMARLWAEGRTNHLQKNALAAKRSAVYTVMQNKFSGKFFIWLLAAGIVCIKQHDYTTQQY
jgi:hypothetical protein